MYFKHDSQEEVFKVPVYWKPCSGMMLQICQGFVDVAYPLMVVGWLAFSMAM